MRQCPNDAAHAIAAELALVIARAWINPPRADFMAALQYLEDRPATRLLCWCHPKQCHCESIERYLVWMGDIARLSTESVQFSWNARIIYWNASCFDWGCTPCCKLTFVICYPVLYVK
jgi:hypothetical protein